MATDTSGSMDPNLQVDEFYAELRAKAQAHPEATVISGFIIESGDQLVRISTGVNSHVDVQPADILAAHKLPSGGTVHFINPRAQVTYGTTATVTPANFLTGALTSAYLGGATGAPADNANGAPQALPPTHLMGCTTVTAAPTHLLGCTTVTAAPTHLLGCTTVTAAPTHLMGCTTVTAAPTHLMGCTTVTAAPTHLMGCTTVTVAPTHLMGCTTVTAAPAHLMGYAGATYTAATQCTHTQHPTCPGGATHTAATVCTQTQHPMCTGGAQQQNGCVAYTIHATMWTQLGCPGSLPQNGCVGNGMHPTIWTQIGCPGSMPQNGCVGNGMHPTIWTQIGCGGPMNTAATVCTQFGCPGGQQAQAVQTLPPASVPPLCPGPLYSLYPCTIVGCPG